MAAAPSASAIRALALEYKSLAEDPVEGFRVKLLNDEDMFLWEVALFGPPDTLYQGGYFKVREMIWLWLIVLTVVCSASVGSCDLTADQHSQHTQILTGCTLYLLYCYFYGTAPYIQSHHYNSTQKPALERLCKIITCILMELLYIELAYSIKRISINCPLLAISLTYTKDFFLRIFT